MRSARFATAQGELPFAVAPGRELHYADLSGPGGQFATLDYGTGNAAEALYVGREVTLADLGLRPREDEERRPVARGESLKCPQCAGPLEVRAPDQTQRIACPWCGSLLDATHDFAILMNDLAPAEQGDQMAGCTPDQAALAVEEAAKLHAPVWDDSTLAFTATYRQRG